MSTRANIIIKESYSYNDENNQPVTETNKLFFYRHSDGYPEGAMPTLSIFMKWLREGKLRTDLQQSAGWLIVLGAMEYNHIPKFELQEPHFKGGHPYGDTDTIQYPKDWKVGAIEPTTAIHGDIEYLYIIDLNKKEVKCYDSWNEETGEGNHEVKLSKDQLSN